MSNKKSTPKTKHEQILEAHHKGSNWLYAANIAGEKGKYELEKRHLARAQKWLDIANELEGYNDN